MFSNKTKVVDTEWRIRSFKQEKKNIADFIIEFEILVMKANTDKLYAIFLLKKNVWQNIIDIGIPAHCGTRITQGVKGSNYLSWTRIQIYRRTTRL